MIKFCQLFKLNNIVTLNKISTFIYISIKNLRYRQDVTPCQLLNSEFSIS